MALHSVLTCLLKSSDDWYQLLFFLSSVVFTDLKKPFDTVDYVILIEKLCHYGVQGRELVWLKSYLQDRKQCCKVNGHSIKNSKRELQCTPGLVPRSTAILIYMLLFIIII